MKEVRRNATWVGYFYFLTGGFENVFGLWGVKKILSYKLCLRGWEWRLGRVYFFRAAEFGWICRWQILKWWREFWVWQREMVISSWEIENSSWKIKISEREIKISGGEMENSSWEIEISSEKIPLKPPDISGHAPKGLKCRKLSLSRMARIKCKTKTAPLGGCCFFWVTKLKVASHR